MSAYNFGVKLGVGNTVYIPHRMPPAGATAKMFVRTSNGRQGVEVPGVTITFEAGRMVVNIPAESATEQYFPNSFKIRVYVAGHIAKVQDGNIYVVRQEAPGGGEGGYEPPAGGIPATDLAPAVQAAVTKASTAVSSQTVQKIVTITQAAYTALATKDPNTLYVVVA